MIAALLLAAAALPAPVVPFASARSIAYGHCVAAEHERRPATVVQIGRGACARSRSKLVEGIRKYSSYGWAATVKTGGQARRLRAHMARTAEAEVARFETELQAWLAGAEGMTHARN